MADVDKLAAALTAAALADLDRQVVDALAQLGSLTKSFGATNQAQATALLSELASGKSTAALAVALPWVLTEKEELVWARVASALQVDAGSKRP